MEQYNFAYDWDHFFDNLQQRITNRQTFEKEYNTIIRKARNVEYDNQTDSACYYYMATLLCYCFCDNNDYSDDDKNWAIKLGTSAISSASRLLQDDEEFKVLSLIFELLGLVKKIDDSIISAKSLFQKLLTINKQCPHIESIENTLIKNEALRTWYNNTYYLIPYVILADGKTEDDLELKIAYASELKNSSTPFNIIAAYTFLSDAYFDKGNYSEAQRYAILGKDVLGSLSKYDHNDIMNKYWGFCWCLYAKCQEEVGDMDFALTLLQRGTTLGIPLCKKELQRMQNERFCKSREVEDSCGEADNSGELNIEYKLTNNIGDPLASNEQEYLDALKESFDDGVISPRERKIIDRLRISLGISEERARELEDSLQA